MDTILKPAVYTDYIENAFVSSETRGAEVGL